MVSHLLLRYAQTTGKDMLIFDENNNRNGFTFGATKKSTEVILALSFYYDYTHLKRIDDFIVTLGVDNVAEAYAGDYYLMDLARFALSKDKCLETNVEEGRNKISSTLIFPTVFPSSLQAEKWLKGKRATYGEILSNEISECVVLDAPLFMLALETELAGITKGVKIEKAYKQHMIKAKETFIALHEEDSDVVEMLERANVQRLLTETG
jgi:hypothetical protein